MQHQTQQVRYRVCFVTFDWDLCSVKGVVSGDIQKQIRKYKESLWSSWRVFIERGGQWSRSVWSES